MKQNGNLIRKTVITRAKPVAICLRRLRQIHRYAWRLTQNDGIHKSIFVLLLLGMMLSTNMSNAQDQQYIDSLDKLLQTDIHDTSRIITLNALGRAWMYRTPDTAIILSNQALELAVKSDDMKGQGNSNSNLGIYHWLKGDYSLSLSHHFKALKAREQQADKKGIVASLGNIGVVYRNQGDYPKALDYYFKALRMGEEIDDKKRIAIQLSNIGVVYWNQADYAKALEYYKRALKIDEEMGYKADIAADLGNIGIVYSNQGKYNKALEYYLRALKVDEEIDNKSGIAIRLGNIGVVYSDQGETTKALEYFFKALKIDEEMDNKNGIAMKLGNIGALYTTVGRFKEAEVYLDRALKMSESIGALSYIKNQHQHLSGLYDTTGRYQLALEHYKKYSTAKDSLFNEGKSKDLGKLEAKHEFESAEAERKRMLEVKSQKENAERTRRDNLQYSGILIVLLLIGGLLSVIGRFSIPVRVVEGLIFFSFLLFFEFSLVMLDPYIEEYSSGAPAIKLAFNAVLAALIFPLHSLFETKLKGRLVKK